MSRQQFTPSERRAFWEAYDRRCGYCGEFVRFATIEIDHIIPERLLDDAAALAEVAKTHGLPAHFDLRTAVNLVPSCRSCNSTKGMKLLLPQQVVIPMARAAEMQPKVLALQRKWQAEKQTDRLVARVSTAMENGLIEASDLDALLGPRQTSTSGLQDQASELSLTSDQNGDAELLAAIGATSAHLLRWPQLSAGIWMDRPEFGELQSVFDGALRSFTVLIGPPGSGKSALLAHLGNELQQSGVRLLAVKADQLPKHIARLDELDEWIGTVIPLSSGLRRLARARPLILLIDQLDALSDLMDLHTSRLSVVLALIDQLRQVDGLHILLSCRDFEYRHDLRLSQLNPTQVRLSDPVWPEAQRVLGTLGIDAANWPQDMKELLRRPQNLSFFVRHFGGTSPPPVFHSYHAMLETVLQTRLIESGDHSGYELLEQIAATMTKDEELWVATARFRPSFKPALEKLEAADLLIFDSARSKFAFRHQTLFDFVRARTFASRAINLAEHVIERQDSLFIRPVLWNALHYTRQADYSEYLDQIESLWSTPGLRRHVRCLIIDFVAQLPDPTNDEAAWFLPLLDGTEWTSRALRSLYGHLGWLPRMLSRLQTLMTGLPATMLQFSWVLRGALDQGSAFAVSAIENHWLPDPQWDSFVLTTIAGITSWDERLVAVMHRIVRRSPDLAESSVEHAIRAISLKLPDSAAGIVAARLWATLEKAEACPATPPPAVEGASEQERVVHAILNSDISWRSVRNLVTDTRSWHDLEKIAQASPFRFLNEVLPWITHVAAKYADGGRELCTRYTDDRIFRSPEARRYRHDGEFMHAALVAVGASVDRSPDEFLRLLEIHSSSELLIVHQLLAAGLARIAPLRPQAALLYLLSDPRRLAIGSSWSSDDTCKIVSAVVPFLNGADRLTLERMVASWNLYSRFSGSDVHERRQMYRWNGEHRVKLLLAFTASGLSPDGYRTVREGCRTFPGLLTENQGEVNGGLVVSPMSATQMGKAKDRDIVGLFAELTDDNDGRRHFSLRGSSVEASREFGEFAKSHPRRALQLFDRLAPRKQERPVSEALAAMMEGALIPAGNAFRVVRELDARGFQSSDFRQRVCWAISTVAQKNLGLSNEDETLLESWLEPSASEPDTEDQPRKVSKRRFLGDSLRTRVLPHGNYPILRALFIGAICRLPMDADLWLGILERHLEMRQESVHVWAALAFHEFSWLRHAEHSRATKFISQVFSRYPALLTHDVAPYFVGCNQRWIDPEFTRHCLEVWESGSWTEGPQAAAEVALYRHCLDPSDKFCADLVERIMSGHVESAPKLAAMRLGLAFACGELWNRAPTRSRATSVLIRILPFADQGLADAVLDVVRLAEPMATDDATRTLLDHLAAHPHLFGYSAGSYLLDRLKDLVRNGDEAERVCAVVAALVSGARTKGSGGLQNFRAPEDLVNIALTLQRLRRTRHSGMRLFEELMELDLYSVEPALQELDRRMPAG
ncbi:MAG: hypothetical protein JWN34_650 [Bryobacterales bacterium]|nr:hypothetical protein [Bryobacterales bacterium]